MYTYRMSTEADRPEIERLIAHRYGTRRSAIDYLENRYLLCFDGDSLIAMSGVQKSTRFKGLEIDWTCTSKEYEGQGIMTEIFKRLLVDITEDVYCSCWRWHDSKYCNLHKIMDRFNFEKVQDSRLSYNAKHYTCPSICVECTGDTCHCFEDLYVRRF